MILAEYIEREALLNHLKHRVAPMSDGEQLIKGVNLALEILEEAVEMLPAADVAPVVHGHWIRQDKSFTRFKCSNPECGIENCSGFENYCPNCGAKMDREEHNNV